MYIVVGDILQATARIEGALMTLNLEHLQNRDIHTPFGRSALNHFLHSFMPMAVEVGKYEDHRIVQEALSMGARIKLQGSQSLELASKSTLWVDFTFRIRLLIKRTPIQLPGLFPSTQGLLLVVYGILTGDFTLGSHVVPQPFSPGFQRKPADVIDLVSDSDEDPKEQGDEPIDVTDTLEPVDEPIAKRLRSRKM